MVIFNATRAQFHCTDHRRVQVAVQSDCAEPELTFHQDYRIIRAICDDDSDELSTVDAFAPRAQRLRGFFFWFRAQNDLPARRSKCTLQALIRSRRRHRRRSTAPLDDRGSARGARSPTACAVCLFIINSFLAARGGYFRHCALRVKRGSVTAARAAGYLEARFWQTHGRRPSRR